MTPEEREALKKERAQLKEALFSWVYGTREERWPEDVKAMKKRFHEVTQKLTEAGAVDRPSPAPPMFNLTDECIAAKEVIAAFRKSHPELEQLDIDYGKLELMVMADLLTKEKDQE